MKNLMLIWLSIPVVSFGQLTLEQEDKIDSLKHVIETAKHDTTIINAWVDWDNIIWISNPELDLELNEKIEALCTNNLQNALSNENTYFFLKNKALAVHNIGIFYGSQGQFDKAIDCYTRSLIIKEEIGDETGIAASLNSIGNIYNTQGDYAKAIDNYTRSLVIREKIGDKKGIGATLNNIAVIYQEQSNFSDALNYYTQSLAIYEEINAESGIAASLNNIGIIYDDLGDYTSASIYFNRSLVIRKKIGDKKGVATCLNNIGNIFVSQNDFEIAIDYYNQSVVIKEEIGDKKGMAMSLNSIGIIYQKLGNYTKAIKYGRRSLELAQEVGAAIEIKESADALYEVYSANGEYRRALEMFELFILKRDSLDSKTNQKEVIRQQFKYDYDKQSLADSLSFAAEQEKAELVMKEQEARLDQEKAQKIGFGIGGGFALLLALVAVFAFVNKRKDNRLIQGQKEEVEIQKAEAEHQREIVEEKNREITDSITYAKRIQTAILPPVRLVKKWLPNSFILYKPKDIIAGDFYWLEAIDSNIIFAVADCTGHGVPGAMVSVVCHNAMNRAVREFGLREPGKILDKVNDLVEETFAKSDEQVRDGMDIALVSLTPNENNNGEESSSDNYPDEDSLFILHYAGAHNPLWIVRKGDITKQRTNFSAGTSINYDSRSGYSLIEVKADKQPIGSYNEHKPYITHNFKLYKGDRFYVFSDGYSDQFGGERGKKFKQKAFRELLLGMQDNSMDEQRLLFDEAFENWKGSLEQLDDVCVIGVRV